MTHDSFREFIQRELDDDLSPTELALLEEHAAACADCRREREQYNSIALGLARLSKVMPERSFVPSITPEMQPSVPTNRRRILPTWWRGLSVAAVVVLAVGFSTHWKWGLSNTRGSDNQVALGSDRKQANQTIDTAPTPTSPTAPTTSNTPDKQPPQAGPGHDSQQPAVSATLDTTASPASQSSPSTNMNESQASAPIAAPTGTAVVADSGQSAAKLVKTLTPPNNTSNDKGTNTVGKGTQTASPMRPAGLVAGGVQAPPATIVGAVPAMADTFNEQLQQEVNGGLSAVVWATNPVQVVQHSLKALGFAPTATVTTTDSINEIQVVQGGMQFEIQLVQPYVQGTNGIWQPVQIGRAISETKHASYEQPILDYFNTQVQQGHLVSHQQIYVVSNLNNGVISVTVDQDRRDGYGRIVTENAQYDFTLHANPDDTWTIDRVTIAK